MFADAGKEIEEGFVMHPTSEDNVLRVEPRGQASHNLALALILLSATGCSSGASDQIDSGGSSSGAGGSSSSGGSGSSGGASDSGASEGGQPDATTSDAGTTVDSGITCLWTFDDAGLGGWMFNSYQTSADPTLDADMGLDPSNLSAQAAPSVDTTVGNPTPGSMMLTIPFTGYNQKADYHVSVIPTAAGDLTNKVITLMAKLEPTSDGGLPFSKSAPAGLVIYIKTGGKYIWGQNVWANITDASKWYTYTFDVSNGYDPVNTKVDAGYDPSSIDEIGFFIDTGGCGVTGDASCQYPNPSEATFHIDNICIQPAPM